MVLTCTTLHFLLLLPGSPSSTLMRVTFWITSYGPIHDSFNLPDSPGVLSNTMDPGGNSLILALLSKCLLDWSLASNPFSVTCVHIVSSLFSSSLIHFITSTFVFSGVKPIDRLGVHLMAKRQNFSCNGHWNLLEAAFFNIGTSVHWSLSTQPLDSGW